MAASLINSLIGSGITKIEDLINVSTSSVADGDYLTWDATALSWRNESFSSAVAGFVPYTGAAFDVNLGAHNLICAEVLTDTVIAENLYFNSVPYDVMVCTSVTSGQLTNVQMGNNLTFFEGELSVTNAALTRTNDTNVTLTLGGSPNSALLAATSMTLGWTGTLAPSRGGTGASTQVTNAICYYDGSKITTSPYATMSFIAGDIDLLITHPSVTGTAYEIVVTSSSCQYVMAYNTASTFQGICGTGATENYWTLSTAGLGLYVSASSLWFGSTSNNDLSFYRNTTERLRLTTTGIYVPDVAYLSAASPTINAMVTGTTLIQSSVRLISAYSGAASANSSYFLGSGNDGGLLQVFGAGGTIASPTALTTDSRMGGVFGRGYAATGYSNAVTAVTFHAESTFTDTSTPSYIAFATTASGATTRTEAMRITSGRNVVIGTTSAAGKLTVSNAGVSGTGLAILSGGATNYVALTMGRTGIDGTLGVAGGSGEFSSSAVQGDFIIRAESSSKNLLLLAGGGTATLCVTSTNVGVATAAPASGYTLDVAGNVIMSNGYRNLSLSGGNSSGFLYGCYAKYGDGIHLGYNFYNNNTSNVIPNAGGPTSRLTLAYGAIACYVGAVNTEPTTLGWLVNGTGETTFGSGISIPRTKPVQFDSSPTSLDNSIHMVNGAPYGLRISGANDAANNRNTQFGYYNAGTWQTRADINNYTGAIYAYSTIGVQNATPTAASYTCGNSGVGASSSYGNYRLLMYDSGVAADSYGIGINSYTLWYNSYQYHEWTARNVRTMLLDGSGLVIGNTGTYARAKLEVVGDIWTDWNDRFIGTVYQAGASYKMGIGTTTGVRALDLIAMSADSSSIRFWTGATPSVNAYIDHVSNVVLGNQSALATNATNGFVYIRTCAGTPTGAPTAFTGHVAMLYDTTNNKLYAYNGSWRSVTLT